MPPKTRAAVPPPRAAGFPELGMVVLLFVVTWVAYLPSLGGRFIWNDSDYVTAPELRSLAGLGAIWFTPGATEQYYPLLHSFFWVQHRLWGDGPLGYHLVTLLLHTGAAWLFALVLRRLAVPGAWLAALLFALHPVHVESVAWITEQKNTLSLAFYLAAALAYLRFDEERRPRAYGAALGLFVVSLLCKTVTVTLPAALLVAGWWRRGRLEWRRDVVPLLPWLALGAVAGLFSSWVEQHYLGAKGVDFDLSPVARVLVAGRAVWFYLGKIVWPFGLNFIYPRWTPDPAVWWQWLFPLGVLALAGALWSVRARTRAPLAAFLLFTGSLFPVLGFVNLYGGLYSFVWDHWQYLPDLAPLALLAAGLTLGWLRMPPAWRPLGPVLAAALVLFLGTLTWRHTRMFHDDLTLYRLTIERNPGAWMAHYNLGTLLAQVPGDRTEASGDASSREAEAIAHYEAALRINSELPDVHYNLAAALARYPDRIPESIAHYEAALRINPRYAAAHYNLGNVFMKMPGRLPDAARHFEAALQANPSLAEAHLNLGVVLVQMPGREREARPHVEKALQLKPEFARAREMLARLGAAGF